MNTEIASPEFSAPQPNMNARAFADTANSGEIRELGAEVPEKFTFNPTEKPDVVAVIQTFNGDAEDKAKYTEENGIPAGDQLALVDLRNAPIDSNTGAKIFMGHKLSASLEYILLGANADIANNKGYKGLRLGESYTFGRFIGNEETAKTDTKSRFTTSDATSRNHFKIEIDENGDVSLTDVGSSNGTRVFTGEKMREAVDSNLSRVESLQALKSRHDLGAASLINTTQVELITEVPKATPNAWAAPAPRFEQAVSKKPDYQNALKVESDELTRIAGNEGNPLSDKYLANQVAARALLVAELAKGYLYQDKDSFTRTILEAHKRAAANNVYQEVGKGSMNLDDNNAGVIRGEGTPTNKRRTGALRVAELSQRYGDRYASRFTKLTPNTVSSSQVELSRIDKKYWPKDFLEADANGIPNMTTYTFEYPDGEGMDSYFSAMADIGKQIDTEINSPNPDKNKALALIAEQYQYGAVARPFDQINNSLFMNLANAQIKALGFKGITHGEMDLAAQRMQVTTFEHYFANRVKGVEM